MAKMRWWILILMLNMQRTFTLRGSLSSICFNVVRKSEYIAIDAERTKEISVWVHETECCDGYIVKGDYCEPRCEPSCLFGECVAPNQCHCRANFTGPSCRIPICPAGYAGGNCDNECPRGTYGQNCDGKCDCVNGECDRVTGRCDCLPGWSGSRCTITCPEDVICINGGICNKNATCDCLPGFIGNQCQQTCIRGYWGKDCLERCDCEDEHYYSCNPSNGTCKSKCVHGDYFDGTCWCESGWDGDFCTEKVCADGYYGENCKNRCSCEPDGTRGCDRITGQCSCYPGRTGENCEKSCPSMTFGEECNSTCTCKAGFHNGCDHTTGKCNCLRGWTGDACNKMCLCQNGYCDNSGYCTCDPGWQGSKCDEVCDDGYYGDGCSNFCGLFVDEGNMVCDPIYGPECAPGFTGDDCSEPCPKGRYGQECKHHCTCESTAICNRFTGECECEPGWMGTKCEKPCPLGLYGMGCENICECSKCRQSDGYCCQPDLNRTSCETYCTVDDFDSGLNICLTRSRNSKSSIHSISSAYLSLLVLTNIFHYIDDR